MEKIFTMFAEDTSEDSEKFTFSLKDDSLRLQKEYPPQLFFDDPDAMTAVQVIYALLDSNRNDQCKR